MIRLFFSFVWSIFAKKANIDLLNFFIEKWLILILWRIVNCFEMYDVMHNIRVNELCWGQQALKYFFHDHNKPELKSLITFRFEPEVIPHYSIIETLGMIAAQNAAEILPFIKVTLSVLVPLLPDMTDEPHKLASTFSRFELFWRMNSFMWQKSIFLALGKLGDAVTYCLTNAEVVSKMGCSKEMYYEEFSSAYEVLTHSWLRTSRSVSLTENVLMALVSIMPLLPKSYDEKFIVKLTPALLNLCRKSNVRLPAAKYVATFRIYSSYIEKNKEKMSKFSHDNWKEKFKIYIMSEN